MKRILTAIGLALCITASAQTNTTTIPAFLGEAYDALVGEGATNLSTAVYGTYTPSVKAWGGGVVVMRNLPIGGGFNTGIGVGLDEYKGSLYGVTAQVGLNASVTPLASWGGWWTNVVTTPLTYIGLGTPFGSSSTTSGQLETIAAVGDAVYLGKLLGADANIIGLYGTRTGLGAASGTFYGGGFSLTWKF